MKKRLITSLAIVLVAGIAMVAYAAQLFTVTNNLSVPAGTITVITNSGKTDIAITGTGTFTGQIPDNATGICINNQYLPVLQNGTVMIWNGTYAKITWGSPSAINIDTQEGN